ncbi:MAG TPA: hypothetical protein VGG39_09370 [Polyangiaceae bacterium]|jgi:hypothetical protein
MRSASLFGVGVLTLASSTAFAAPPPPAPRPAAPVASPAPPPPSGEVRLTDQGQTTTLPDGVVVAFEPNTTARWAGSGKIANELAKWTQGFHLDLTDGEVDVVIPDAPKGAHAFLLSTKAGTLTDWRGSMHVTVRGDSTAIALYDGAIVVGSNRQSFHVTDPTAIVLHKGGEPEKARALPGIPAWDAAGGGPQPFAVVADGQPALLGFAWTSASGAKSYRVQIATDPDMKQVVQRAAVGDQHFTLPAPSPGVHEFAQVRAVGDDGIVGPWSAPRALRAAHFRLPPGAFVARDGAVVLPFGTSLPVTDGDGLDVAYENVRPGPPLPTPAILYWSKLSGPLRTVDDAPVRVAHLRDASLGVEARVVLAKRELRAEVDMQPRHATARDFIDVRVVASDPSGRIDVGSENITVQAMKDLDAVPVAWQRNGNVWTGRIGPRSGTIASVVRVVVRDGLGEEIGRGFVEIPATGGSTR